MIGIFIEQGEELNVKWRYETNWHRLWGKPKYKIYDTKITAQGVMGEIVFFLENNKYPSSTTREVWDKLRSNPNTWEIK